MPTISDFILDQMTFGGQYAAIPQHMRESIMNYVLHRIEPGAFLSAVICNDLRGAACNADPENLALLKLYVLWFYNCCPACFVGRDNFRKHVDA